MIGCGVGGAKGKCQGKRDESIAQTSENLLRFSLGSRRNVKKYRFSEAQIIAAPEGRTVGGDMAPRPAG